MSSIQISKVSKIAKAGLVGCALLAGAGTAFAADPVAPRTGTPAASPFFASITGFYILPNTGTKSDIVAGNGRVAPNDGFGGALHAGYRFHPVFDVAIGVSGAGLGKRSAVAGTLTATNAASYVAVDLEGGYNTRLGTSNLRAFGGLRYASWQHEHRFTIAGGGGGSPGVGDVDSWGIGPRIGFDANVALQGNFGLFAGASASVLFGTLKESGSFGGGFVAPNLSKSLTMLNVDLKAGVTYALARDFTLALGYRLDYWQGPTLKTWTGPVGGPGTGRGDRFNHGPFVRLAYNY